MSNIAVFLISLYQILISRILHNIVGLSTACRFNPTCSQYAKQSFQRYGFIRGMWYTLKRVLSCQSFFSIQ